MTNTIRRRAPQTYEAPRKRPGFWASVPRGVFIFLMIVLGAGVLAGSFFITLWLITPEPDQPLPSAASLLAKRTISDDRTLSAGAASLGLQMSDSVKGFVDALVRLNDRQVKISGWVADTKGQGAPITVLVFADGQNVLETETKGVRADVEAALKLRSRVGPNIVLDAIFSCRPGQTLLGVAVTDSRLYASLDHPAGPLICPG